MDFYSMGPGRLGRDSYPSNMGESVMFAHPATRKSGTKTVAMTKEPVFISNWSGAVVEINVGDSTTFRSESLEIAKAFLLSLEKSQVQMVAGPNRIHTAADIAYLILERAA